MDTTFLYLILWAGFFAIVFAVLIKKRWLLGGGKLSSPKSHLDVNFVRNKWQEIETLMQQGKPSAYKVAILDADKLIDYVLKARVGTDGTMVDRLKKAKSLFSNYSDYQNLWEAHKMRNRMVHEAEHEIYPVEVKKAISYFEKALRELRAI